MRNLQPSPPNAQPVAAALSAALTEMVRRCRSAECAGLEVPWAAVPVIAVAALDEAANSGGGLVWRPRHGGLWLLGASQGAAHRARVLIEGMGWAAATLSFPQDMPRLEAALAAETDPASPSPAILAMAPLAEIEERAARLGAEAGHGLTTLWRMAGKAPNLLGQRWMVEPEALVSGAAEQDWQGHAHALLGARLLDRARAGQWPAGRKHNLPLLLDMPWMPPPASLPPPPDSSPGHALVLPLAAAADAQAWQALASHAGWGLAWNGLTPSLAWLATPERLPGDWFFARFSAEAAQAAWPRPGQLAFCPTSDRAALAYCLAGGVAMCSRMAA